MIYLSKADDADWPFPLSESYAEGMLAVSAAPPHRIYWQSYGNPGGEPVMFLHGGPGGGCLSWMARLFDPARYRIILFDQRGCGRSEPNVADNPVAGLADNTTPHLIADIEKLRAHLGITGKMHVFGGSWGSTLALAYAIAYPECVANLILRGIFLCRKIDLDYFYQGNAASFAEDPLSTPLPGTYAKFREVWKPYVEFIPPERRGDMVKAYADIFAREPQSAEEMAHQDEAARRWSGWEGRTSFLSPDPAALEHYDEPRFAKAFARIENHYFMNGAFLGGAGEANRDNNYLLENIAAIAHLPIHTVHGRYDEVCPIFQADALGAALQKAGANQIDYRITAAGHSMTERENLRQLTDILERLAVI